MGKASSSKKVARAARTGGGRTRRGTSSWGWPVMMALVVILGTAGIVYSREGREVDTTPPRPQSQRGGDHWHSAIGFYVCGSFLPPPPDPKVDALGIHTHGDGVIHTHPFTEKGSGRRAKLKLFLENIDAKVTDETLDVPGQPVKKNGMKCGDKEGEVRVKVWDSRDPANEGRVFSGEPGELLLGNNQLITVAFIPDEEEIPKPASESQLDNLTDVEPPASPGSIPPPGETPAPPANTETTGDPANPAPTAGTTAPTPPTPTPAP